MQSLYLMGKRIVELDNEEWITLNYCLVEEHKLRARPIYGIRIIQENNSTHAVSDYSDPISYSRSYVIGILNKLMDNQVLISNFLETVDDLVV